MYNEYNYKLIVLNRLIITRSINVIVRTNPLSSLMIWFVHKGNAVLVSGVTENIKDVTLKQYFSMFLDNEGLNVQFTSIKDRNEMLAHFDTKEGEHIFKNGKYSTETIILS